jgi:hypothetical protein
VTVFPNGLETDLQSQLALPWVTLGQWHRMEIFLRCADGLPEWCWMGRCGGGTPGSPLRPMGGRKIP